MNYVELDQWELAVNACAGDLCLHGRRDCLVCSVGSFGSLVTAGAQAGNKARLAVQREPTMNTSAGDLCLHGRWDCLVCSVGAFGPSNCAQKLRPLPLV